MQACTLPTRSAVLSIAAAALLAACGGGGGDSTTTALPTQTAVGTITAFGSVVVNGVRFDDSGATVTINGDAATRDRLRVGMVVRINGAINSGGTGTASTIRYEDCLRGPVTALNQQQNTVEVMGVPVLVDDSTVFDGVTLRDMNQFAEGDMVSVSCIEDRAGAQLRAQRMERIGTFQFGVSQLELTGTVSDLDMNARTMTLNGVTVNFSGVGAASIPAGLANGMGLQVRGVANSAGLLTADRLRDRDRDRDRLHDSDGLELEGYVSQFVSLANFLVDGQQVNAANAVIRNGTAADIINGAKVEVEGTMQNNVLVATLVILRRQCNVQIDAGLQAKDTTAATLTLMGRSIKVTADTELRDELASSSQPTVLTLAALNTGDRLEVNACTNSDGSLTASRVERTAPDELVVVKGPVAAKVPTTSITIAGVPVATGASTEYRDTTGTPVDAVTFYSAVQVPPAVPSIVHARGVVPNLAATTLDATRTTSSRGELELHAF